MNNSIILRLDQIIIRLSNGTLEPSELNDTTDLIVDAGFDSLSLVECIVEIEREFDFIFDDDYMEMEKLQSYSTIKNYVLSKVSEE